jgi:hypothetical protein
MLSRYTIFQYVPDLISGERINFGIAAYDEREIEVRFISRWSRVRQFAGKDVAFLKDFADRIRESADASALLTDVGEIRRLDHELITRMAARWKRSIQVTEPRVSTLSCHRLADQIEAKVLRSGAGETKSGGLRKVAQQAVVHGVRAAVSAVDDVVDGNARDLVKTSAVLRGELTDNRFDAVVQNGTPILAAHGISFQGTSDGHAANAVNAISFMLADVRHRLKDIPLALVALPPRIDVTGEYERALEICRQIKVDVVGPGDVEQWARPVVERYFYS